MKTIKIKGMACEHCVRAVLKALSGIDGLKDVSVDLENAQATYEETKPVDERLIRARIEEAGYEIG